MMAQDQIGNLDPTQISVDQEGRVVITHPVLAAALRNQLSSGTPATAQAAARTRASVNIIACGNHCAALE
jgi:hypothetical protein